MEVKVHTVEEALMIKLFHNSYDAFLISLSNLMSDILTSNGVDYNPVKEGVELMLSQRTKLKNPGNGYGGSCYPKDSKSLLNITNDFETIKLLHELDEYNTSRSYLFKRHIEEYKEADKILILGVSFKGETNDIVDSPVLSMINDLQSWDNVYYYEPGINNDNYKNVYPILKDIDINFIQKEEIEDFNTIVISSDWKEFTTFDYSNKVVYDYKGLLNKKQLDNTKKYWSVLYSNK